MNSGGESGFWGALSSSFPSLFFFCFDVERERVRDR
jgi:hypothetical protein